jgi:hypothetical protein
MHARVTSGSSNGVSIKARLEEVKREKELVEKERELVEQVVVDLRRSRSELLSPRSSQAAASPPLTSPRSADSLLSSPRSSNASTGPALPSPRSAALSSPRSAPSISPRSVVAPASPKTPKAAGVSVASPRHSSPGNSKSLSHLPQELRESRELMISAPRAAVKGGSPRAGSGPQTRPVVPKLGSPVVPKLASPAAPVAAAQQAPLSPPMSPRSFVEPVIREILKTEDAYLHDLRLMVLHFREPSRAILSVEDVETLFANLDGLVALHAVFSAELTQESTKALTSQNWGLVFRNHVGAFRREYQVYTKNQGKARARRIALEQGHERFKQLIATTLKHPDIKLTDLNSYLIKPVQRICKYPLLLRELSKAFEAMGIVNDAAKRDLAESMAAMSDVLKEANDYMTTLRPSRSGRVATPGAQAMQAAMAAVEVCAFCKKQVAATQRRVEEGQVFHTGLCYVRFLGQYLSETITSSGRDDLDSALARAEEEQNRAKELLQASSIEQALAVPSLKEHLRSSVAVADDDEDEVDDDPYD